MNTLPLGRLTTRDPADTEALGARIAAALPDGSVVALYGGLGTGKTCLVRGMATGLGIAAAVTSPTFTLVNEYRGPRALYHIDLYRLRDAEDALAMGIEMYLAPEDGLTVIEWAERAAALLAPIALRIRLAAPVAGSLRRVCIRRPPAARAAANDPTSPPRQVRGFVGQGRESPYRPPFS